jgi:hypothetical protein
MRAEEVCGEERWRGARWSGEDEAGSLGGSEIRPGQWGKYPYGRWRWIGYFSLRFFPFLLFFPFLENLREILRYGMRPYVYVRGDVQRQ